MDGITFDSKKEANRYLQLKELEVQGAITGLELQKPFLLIPEQREPDTVGKRGGIIKGKLIERKCEYIADFYYYQDGKEVVEDVKGLKIGAGYQIFKLKKKLMLYVHNIRIKEI